MLSLLYLSVLMNLAIVAYYPEIILRGYHFQQAISQLALE